MEDWHLKNKLKHISNDDLTELLKVRDYHNQKFNQLKVGMFFLLSSGHDDFLQEITEIDYYTRTFIYVDHSIKINSKPVAHTSAYNAVPEEIWLDKELKTKYKYEEYHDNNGAIHLPKQYPGIINRKKQINPVQSYLYENPEYNKDSLQQIHRMESRFISHTTGIYCAKCGFSNKVDNRGILPFVSDMLNNQLVNISFKCSNCDESYDLGLLSLIKKQF